MNNVKVPEKPKKFEEREPHGFDHHSYNDGKRDGYNQAVEKYEAYHKAVLEGIKEELTKNANFITEADSILDRNYKKGLLEAIQLINDALKKTGR